MRVLVSGASGLIGTALCDSLGADGADVVRLVRRSPETVDEVRWDPSAGELDPAAIEGFDAVVHLAGAGIGDKRWSEGRRREILESRVASTELLAARLAKAASPPEVFISGSAIGFYGDRVDPVSESDGPTRGDFLSDVTVAWEAATKAAEIAGIRTVHIRTGIVLSADGGALQKVLLPFKLGVGGKLGKGDTWWSWISIHDQVGAIKHIMMAPVHGPVNLTSPGAVLNVSFVKALGRALRRPSILPVQRFALEMLLGRDLAKALLFTSARVLPDKLIDSGFEFQHRDLDSALKSVLVSR